MDIFKIVGKIVMEGVDKAVNDLKSTTSEANKSSTALGKIGTAIKNAFGGNKTEAFGTSLEKLTSRVSTQQNKVELLKQKYADLYLTQGKNSAEAKEVAEEIEKLSKELVENRSKLSEAEAAANEFDESLDDAGNEADEFGEKSEDAAKKSSSAFSDLASVVGKTVVKAIAAATTAIGAVVGYSVKVGSDFEAAISNVAATMGTTTDQIDAITQKAKELGEATKFSATEAAEGFNILAQSGLSLEDQLSTIDSVLSLAAAGEMSMADAAGYVTTTMKAMSIEMDEAGSNANYVADIYAKGANLANTSTAQFGEAMTSAASVAGAYNQSLETTGTALLLLAEKGYQGSEAGTYLSRAMADLYAPTDDASKALNALGVATYDAQGNQRDFVDIVNDLNDAFSTMTEEEEAAYTSTIFTMAGVKAFNSIAANSAEEIANLTDTLTDCSGAAEEMADTKLDNLQGRITILKSAAEGFGITLYEQFSGKAQSAVETLTDAVSRLTEAFQTGGVDGLIEEFGIIFSEIITSISAELPTMIESGLQLIRALGQGLIDAIPELIPVAIEAILTITTGLLEMLPEITQAAFDIITELGSGLVEAFPQLLETVVSTLVTLLPQLISGLVSLIVSLCAALPEIIQPIIEALPEIILSIVGALMENLTALIDGAVQLVVGLVAALPEIILTLLDALPEVIVMVVNGLLGALPTLIEGVGSIITSVVAAVWEFLSGFPESVANYVTTITDNIGNVITGVWETIKATVSTVVNTIWTNISTAFTGIVTTVTNIVNSILTTITDVFESIKTTISDKIEAAKSAVSTAIEAIKGFFNFEWSLPDLKLPHFSFSGQFSLNPLSVPTLSVNWYAKGGVLEEPTIFGVNGNTLMGGGEAGKEAVAPIDVLQGYVADAVASQNMMIVSVLEKILIAIESMDANMGGNMREAMDGLRVDMNRREVGRIVRAVT